jgi:hypothetical protein
VENLSANVTKVTPGTGHKTGKAHAIDHSDESGAYEPMESRGGPINKGDAAKESSKDLLAKKREEDLTRHRGLLASSSSKRVVVHLRHLNGELQHPANHEDTRRGEEHSQKQVYASHTPTMTRASVHVPHLLLLAQLCELSCSDSIYQFVTGSSYILLKQHLMNHGRDQSGPYRIKSDLLGFKRETSCDESQAQ